MKHSRPLLLIIFGILFPFSSDFNYIISQFHSSHQFIAVRKSRWLETVNDTFLVRFDLANPFFASQTKRAVSMTNQNSPNGAVTEIKITTENNNIIGFFFI